MIPNLHTTTNIVRAQITTAWKKNQYTQHTIYSVENYYVDTALDNDADTWTLGIGDPRGDLMALLPRNNEIRVKIFGVAQNQTTYLMTGVADDAHYEDGSWLLTGRDFSSLATDSTVPPQHFNRARSWSIIGQQAKQLGFPNLNLAKQGVIKKTQYTDGSESYWDFWYRLVRKDRMWIWTLPNGTLVSGQLDYKPTPDYYLGDFKDTDNHLVKSMCIPVIDPPVFHKQTQNRLYEVMVYGHRGITGFNTTVRDSTMAHWVKKPRKIMLDTDSHTVTGAKKTAFEEIFEGKVGSVELTITIPDPGYVLQQNKVARLYIPDYNMDGLFYLVGSRVQGGPEGFVQEIRLRELNYAMTRRVPSDPKAPQGPPGQAITGQGLGANLESGAGMPTGWGDYFVKAAKQFHGAVDYNLFLACLLGICRAETTFQNIRQHGMVSVGTDGAEWHPDPSLNPNTSAVAGGITKQMMHLAWMETFANDPGGPFNVPANVGVGPMQLTSQGLKYEADDHFKPNFRNEYAGGRWHPEHNIWIAAQYFANCVTGTHYSNSNDIWIAIDAYNRGIGGAQSYFAANGTVSPYAQKVRGFINTDPGYLAQVKSAIQATREAQAAASAGDGTDAPSNSNPGNYPLPSANEIQRFYHSYFHALATEAQRRQAIVYAALWGVYHHNQMKWNEVRPIPRVHFPDYPKVTDCSGFATWCYYAAGAFDPNGYSYNGQGSTYSLQAHGQRTSYAQIKPGDLIFYNSPAHVVIYVGHGYIVSHGTQGDPRLVPYAGWRSDGSGMATYFV